ncbi:MAG TPA: serine/threonine-protein kinase, partial [Pyrinomonadaceae bacterium]|nr:serine/threonine-protein kinase [Pyrinomonadaceae bacterium]
MTPGTKLGRYEIRSKIGEGGMGEVYRARDGNLNRDVAIKILPREFSENAERLNRFEQEAQAAGALNHPNILAVYDVGKHEDSPFVVSELLEGQNLRAAAHGAPLPQRKAIDYALQIARGLGAAHEKGIVHRDLKPDNIFVTKDGHVKILDFGLAKLIEPIGKNVGQTDVPTRKVRTDAGMVMGTVGYMSPEQVRGQPVDHRSDIFSFGAVFYEILSGQKAFKGDSAVETLNSILKEEPAELTGTNQNISPAVERVVSHCLEKNPESRFQTAADLVFALENVSLTKSDTGFSQVLSQPARPVRRERLIWIAAVLLLLVGITAIALWSFRKPSREIETARFPIAIPAGTYPIVDVEEHNMAISPDGQYLAFVLLSAGKRVVGVRPIGSLSAQTLPGTEGAYSLFW